MKPKKYYFLFLKNLLLIKFRNEIIIFENFKNENIDTKYGTNGVQNNPK